VRYSVQYLITHFILQVQLIAATDTIMIQLIGSCAARLGIFIISIMKSFALVLGMIVRHPIRTRASCSQWTIQAFGPTGFDPAGFEINVETFMGYELAALVRTRFIPSRR
jgi:hypothetical protein